MLVELKVHHTSNLIERLIKSQPIQDAFVLGEVISGAAAMLPGVGTAVSVAVDCALVAFDVMVEIV